MIRRKRGEEIGYDFTPLPCELHPLWTGVSMHTFGLCVRLFQLTGGGKPYPLHGDDWRGWLCRQLLLKGDERKNVRKTLKHLYESGIIRVEPGSKGRVIVVGFHPSFDAQPQVDDWVEPGTKPASIGGGSGSDLTQGCTAIAPDLTQTCTKTAPVRGVQSESTIQNDSSLKIQREESRERRSEEREKPDEATAPVLPFRPTTARREQPPLPEPPPEEVARHERAEAARLKELAKARDPDGKQADAEFAKRAWISVCERLDPGRGYEIPHKFVSAGEIARSILATTQQHGADASLVHILKCAFFAFVASKKRSKCKRIQFDWILEGDQFACFLAEGQESNPTDFRVTYTPIALPAGAAE